MGIERICAMKERAMALAEQGLNQDVSCIDANELGEIIDVVKDLSEAAYYCSIVEAMEKSEKQEEIDKAIAKHIPETQMYYPTRSPYYRMAPEMEQYYTRTPMARGTRPRRYMYDRDPREGMSGEYRRNYMDMKENGNTEMAYKHLEDYVHSLTDDVMEMVENMDAKEKQMLKQKITGLASKIV